MLPNQLIASIKNQSQELSQKLVTWRRHLHAHPELSFKEFNTQKYLLNCLAEIGIKGAKPIADTGVLVLLEGVKPSEKCVAIRADIDALPIQEVAGRPYGSTVPGVMHACGHDVHATCALGACKLLFDNRHLWEGTIKIIFQPGEELLPGGAKKVIEAGGLKHPDVVAIIGLHVAPSIEVGNLGLRSGAYMASTDELYIRLKGDGGHAALAHQHVDLVAVAAQMLTSLQQVVSRKAPPGIPTVLSFGKIDSIGGATNVLTSQINLAGTFRTYDERWRTEAHNWIRKIVLGVAQSLGAEVDLEIRKGYPALHNNEKVSNILSRSFKTYFGDDRLKHLEIRPTAEDFAWYLQKVPGAFFRLGVANREKGITAGVHQPQFDVDEQCLPIGASALSLGALNCLQTVLEQGMIE